MNRKIDKNSFLLDDVLSLVEERQKRRKEKKEIKKDIRRITHEESNGC